MAQMVFDRCDGYMYHLDARYSTLQVSAKHSGQGQLGSVHSSYPMGSQDIYVFGISRSRLVAICHLAEVFLR